jgi:uncharacterized protein
MESRFLNILHPALLAAIAVIIILTVLLMVYENKFIYFPDRYPTGQYLQAANIPSLADCWMTTEDGLKLHAWYLPADHPLATIVMAHGNAGNISNRIGMMSALRQYGFSVFQFDYRGYGRSEGTPSEEGIYIDGQTAFDFAAKLPQVDPDKIVLWGTSLGGAVAVDVATKRQAAVLILESTFTSAGDMADIYYPFARYLLKTKMNSIGKISQIHTPLLILHGRKDSTVPIRLGQELYAAANDPKEFYEITNAGHNDTSSAGGEAYFQHVRNFLLKYIPQ